MIGKSNPQLSAGRKVYIQGFGLSECSACRRKTVGKLCDYVIGACGGYYNNCVPLCSRCHKRVAKAIQPGSTRDGQ